MSESFHLGAVIDKARRLNPDHVVVPSPESIAEPMRAKLGDFINRPITTAECITKDDFTSKIQPWLTRAMVESGYPLAEIDGRLRAFFEEPNFFMREPNEVVADINSFVIAVIAELLQTPVAEVTSEIAKTLEPLVLTPDLRVNVEKTVPLETVIQNTESIETENPKSPYREKFEALNSEPFTREAYLNYTFELHTGLRSRYDAVITNAEKNLKRYSSTYTPSKTEKEALQFLSSVKSRYVSIQKSESEMGVLRAELVNSPNRTDAQTSEADVKTFTERYLTEVEKLLLNISKLENLIEIAKTEEKPHFAEAYRAQFETMRVEGNKVLATLPTDQPYYASFKQMIEGDLAKLIEKTANENDNNGDKYVTHSFDFISLTRNRIKAATAYFKAEQEHQNFKARQLEQVRALEVEVGAVTDTLSNSARELQKQIFSNIEIIKNKLGTAGTLPEGVELSRLAELTLVDATQDFVMQKDQVRSLLRETGEILEEFKKYTAPAEVNEAEVAPVTNIEAVLPPHVLVVSEKLIARRNELQKQIPESAVARGRIAKILSLITPKRVGYLAAIVAGAALLSDKEYAFSEFKSATISPLLGMSLMTPATHDAQIDRVSIESYLKAMAPDPIKSLESVMARNSESISQPEVQPSVPSYQPEQVPVELEVVPGVTLHPNRDEATVRSQAPDLKIYSDKADKLPSDPGVTLLPSEKTESAAPVKNELYEISYGDVFWDIAEGQSLAGTLPVMKQINPYFKQALIDRLRDRLNTSKELREGIGGFGDSADDLITGQELNKTKLNDEAVLLAINYGYLQ